MAERRKARSLASQVVDYRNSLQIDYKTGGVENFPNKLIVGVASKVTK